MTAGRDVIVSRHSNVWPFERRQVLKHATKLDYAFVLSGVGKFQFDLPASDPCTTDEIGTSLIGIKSGTGMQDFVGMVEAVQDNEDGATVTVLGKEWVGVFGDRLTPKTQPEAGHAGRAAMRIGRAANARTHTGIALPEPQSGSQLPSGFDTQGSSVLQVWTNIAALTLDEWECSYAVTERVSAGVAWGVSIGSDLRSTVHVFDRQMGQRQYEFDILNEAATTRAVTGSGSYALRPASLAARANRGLKQFARYRPAIAQRELSSDDPSIATQEAADAQALAKLLTLDTADTVIVAAGPDIDWSALSVGNIITVRLSRARFGQGFVSGYKILGVQPDHSSDLLHMIGKAVV